LDKDVLDSYGKKKKL